MPALDLSIARQAARVAALSAVTTAASPHAARQQLGAAERLLSSLKSQRAELAQPAPQGPQQLDDLPNTFFEARQSPTEADGEIGVVARALGAEGIPPENVVIDAVDWDYLGNISSRHAWWLLRSTTSKKENVEQLIQKCNFEDALGLDTEAKLFIMLVLLHHDYMHGVNGAHAIRSIVHQPELVKTTLEATAAALSEAGFDSDAESIRSSEYQLAASDAFAIFRSGSSSSRFSLKELAHEMAQGQQEAKESLASPNLDFSASAQAQGARGRQRRSDRPALGGRAPQQERTRKVFNPSKGISSRIGAGTTPGGFSLRFPTNCGRLGAEPPRQPPPATTAADDDEKPVGASVAPKRKAAQPRAAPANKTPVPGRSVEREGQEERRRQHVDPQEEQDQERDQ